ncbi:hypothetical protein T439DRAFT_354848 [Meredithblackwellia eburnea MCA 4105]
MSVYCGWKCVEWGVVKDRSVYKWIGFDQKDKDRAEVSGEGGDGEAEAPMPSIFELARWTFHLMCSMRGTGWAFSVVPPRPQPRISMPKFLLHSLVTLAWSHTLLVLCCIVISSPYTERVAFATTYILPPTPPNILFVLLESFSYVACGFAAWVALLTGYQLHILAALALHLAFRNLPLIPAGLRPKPFDNREYAPLFSMPFAPKSVKEYWSHQWHRLFWRSFNFLALEPVQTFVAPLAGKEVARAAGVMAVFGLSAVIHEYAVLCASFGITPPRERTTILQIWGSTFFFLLMGTFSIIETFLTRKYGIRSRGLWGFIYTSTLQSISGVLLYSSWANLGFTSSLPTVDQWSWKRFALPMLCFAPAPFGTKKGQ